MSFIRSDSGILNYAKFYGADVIIYTEGKMVTEKNLNEVIPDCEFYFGLLSNLIPNKKIKVKAIGNKNTALEYAKKIIESRAKNSFVFIDRDYEGMKCSIVNNPIIIQTFGYSWENDLWNSILCKEILTDLTFNNVKAISSFDIISQRVIKRAYFLSLLDALLQLDGRCLLPKNKSNFGINIDLNKPFPISKKDISRLVSKFKIDSVNISFKKEAFEYFSKFKAELMIQGHFWCNLMIKIISHLYTKLTGDNMPSKALILNIGLSKLRSNPRKMMSSTYNYYHDEIKSKVLPVLI